MESNLDMQAEDSGTSNLIREGEQGNTEMAEGMGSMPCPNTITDATTGGTSTMTTAEQMFSERVMGIMDYARGHLSQYPSIREQIEYWNEIVEAWEECTGNSLVQGDLSDLEWAIECKDQDLLDEAIDELDDEELDEAIDALDETTVAVLQTLKPELFAEEEKLARQLAKKTKENRISDLSRKAEQGDALAQSELGMLYAKGNDVPQDYKKSCEWWEKAAAQGNASAQVNLGVMYHNGYGVTQNYDKARELLEQAAEQGNVNAMMCLGRLALMRLSYDEAREWYEKAHELGHQDAIAALTELAKVIKGKG